MNGRKDAAGGLGAPDNLREKRSGPQGSVTAFYRALNAYFQSHWLTLVGQETSSLLFPVVLIQCLNAKLIESVENEMAQKRNCGFGATNTTLISKIGTRKGETPLLSWKRPKRGSWIIYFYTAK